MAEGDRNDKTGLQGVLDDLDITADTDLDEPGLLEKIVFQPLDVFDKWKSVENQKWDLKSPQRHGVFTPPQRDEAMEQLIAKQDPGRIFRERGDCKKCHGITALGDGESALDFDDWNKDKKGRTADEIAQMWTLPIQRVKPRNLRLGTFRGGRRPVDIYRRIAIGINGTPMPDHMTIAAGDKKLEPHEIWALVDYVLHHLPYEDGGELQRAEKPVPDKEHLGG
jgi:mono/diheme cytochrome c family protein